MRFVYILLAIVSMWLIGTAFAKAEPPVSVVAGVVDPLAKGVLILKGQDRHVTAEFAARLSTEVRELVAKPENNWIPANLLLGIALNESELRYWVASATGADCGITQVNVLMHARGAKRQMQLCQFLQKSTKGAFEYTMKELNIVKEKYCTEAVLARMYRWNGGQGAYKPSRLDFLHCVLNVYNQGPVYTTYLVNQCDYVWKSREDGDKEKMEARKKYCESRNKYWVRTLCFAESVRNARMPVFKYGRREVKASCRAMWKISWVAKAFDMTETQLEAAYK